MEQGNHNFGPKFSVVIICFNEEDHIERCINSCLSISEEIIVIDSGSTDQTVHLAQKCGATVIQKKWEGYGKAKNFGALQATSDWILSLDADEAIDDIARNTLSTLQLKPNSVYGFNRLNHIGDVPIKYGEWNPDIKMRLFNKNEISWTLDNVHEALYIPSRTNQIQLDGLILHYSYMNIQDLNLKLAHYARLSAEDLINKKMKLSFPEALLKSVFRFLKSYIFKLGFRDGRIGYEIAMAYSEYVLLKYKNYQKFIKSKT